MRKTMAMDLELLDDKEKSQLSTIFKGVEALLRDDEAITRIKAEQVNMYDWRLSYHDKTHRS